MSNDLLDSPPDTRQIVTPTTVLEASNTPASRRPSAESEARYAKALSLVRSEGYSLRAAAIESELDPSNFHKRIKRLNETIPDAEQRHRAAEDRILTMAEDLSEAAGQKLLEEVESNRLRPADLVKTFNAATNQVAAKRRRNQGLNTGDARTQDALASALQRLRDGASIRIEKPDAVNEAIDITPSDEAVDTTGAP